MPDTGHINEQIRLYLADCAERQITSTEAGCLKAVHHATDAQKQAVIWAYRRPKSDQYSAAESAGAETAYRVLKTQAGES